jgi:hypothetical protein
MRCWLFRLPAPAHGYLRSESRHTQGTLFQGHDQGPIQGRRTRIRHKQAAGSGAGTVQ